MPVVPLTARLEQTYRSTGAATATNVLHFITLGGTFTQAVMDDLQLAWSSAMDNVLNANWLIEGAIRCLDLRVDPPDEIFTANADDAGQVTGPALPPACAAVISTSGGANRRRRGRIYLPGMTESEWSDDGQAGTGVAAAIADAFEDFATAAVSSAGWVPAVYSRTDGVSRVVTSFTVDGNLDTQRRRQQRLAT